MPKDWTAQISHVNFRCGECRKAFEGAPDLVEDDAEQAHHPYRYFAHCPHCGARHQPQAGWERALLKAHQHSTGPKTPEGVEKLVSVRQKLYALKPEFFSVTYGAGGSTQEGTFATVGAIQNEGVAAASHFSCIGATKASVRGELADRKSVV